VFKHHFAQYGLVDIRFLNRLTAGTLVVNVAVLGLDVVKQFNTGSVFKVAHSERYLNLMIEQGVQED